MTLERDDRVEAYRRLSIRPYSALTKASVLKIGEELDAAKRAAEDLLELAARTGGSVSGEHGLGLFKRGQLARQWNERALTLHAEIKRVFDPKNLLNPGKKLGVAEAPDLSFVRT